MTTLHIIATGPIASGKSTIVRYLAKHPPPGYKCTKEVPAIPETSGAEYWFLEFKKTRVRRP